MRSRQRGRGDLEAEVLRIVWSADVPVTPGDVLDRLDGKLAYTTVMTVLSRLWAKGLLQRDLVGKAYVYRPVMSEAELTAEQMQRTVHAATDPAAVLSKFVEKLSDEDAAMMRRFLGDRTST